VVLFFRILARLFVLAFAYFASSIAAMLMLMMSLLAWQAEVRSPDEEVLHFFFSSAFVLSAFLYVTTTAIAPAALFGLLTEAFSWRSIFVHVVAGGMLGFYLLIATGRYGAKIPPQPDLILVLASGFIAGAIYWLIAGRNAGGWR